MSVRARKPRKISTSGVELWPSVSAVEAFHLIGGDVLRQLAESLERVHPSKPDGLHEMRVSLRRIDAMLKLFPDQLTAQQSKHILTELKWIGRTLSLARDVDVFTSDVVMPLKAKYPADTRVLSLYRKCLIRQNSEYRRVQSMLASERFRVFRLRTAEAIQNAVAKPGLDRPARQIAAESLARMTKKMKGGRRLKELEQHDIHKFRLRVKRIRYALEFVQGLCVGKRECKRLDTSLAALRRMQSALGEVGDLAVRRHLFDRVMGRSRIAGPSAKPRISGLKLKNARRTRKCLKQCLDAYDCFSRAKPFLV